MSGCGPGVNGCMSDGDLWTALITYDGTYLNLALTDGSDVTENPISNYAIDVGSYLGTSTAYVGFTGAAGEGFENEDILNWEFSNTSTLPRRRRPPRNRAASRFWEAV